MKSRYICSSFLSIRKLLRCKNRESKSICASEGADHAFDFNYHTSAEVHRIDREELFTYLTLHVKMTGRRLTPLLSLRIRSNHPPTAVASVALKVRVEEATGISIYLMYQARVVCGPVR